MLRQIGFEIFKMSRRPRTYLGTAAFALICIAVMLGMKYGDVGSMVTSQAAGQGFGVVGSPANAEYMAWMVVASPFVAMPILTMFMPFFVALVFGEIFAGESTDGTLRALLSRPVTRGSVFAAKLAACFVYVLGLVFSLGVLAYIIGLIFFGHGGLMAVTFADRTTYTSPMLAWFTEGDGLNRLALGYLLTTVAMSVVGMIAFFIGVWLNNALGAIGGSIMLLFTMFVIGEIPYFKPIREYLFSSHLVVGQRAFVDPIPWKDIGSSLVCLGIYLAVLVMASGLVFRRKDILT
ncbi:MAG: ABC transporter permease subunit [Armatimonadota bacterium]|nr:ABC transporter permease [bacterium]